MTEFIKVATVDEIAVGEKLVVEYDDEDVGLVNLAGEIYAMSDVCPHDDGPLMEGELAGDCIVCPRHGAQFNLKTGDYTMPSFSPAPRYHVKIEDGDILIAPMDD